MTDSTNNKELVAVGHEFARHMSSDTPIIDIAKMVTRLASQLDVTTMALRQANAELKASVAAEIEWEKAMMEVIGSDGIADVVSAIEKLKADGAALAAENAALLEQSEEVYAAGYNHGHLNTVDGIAYAPCVKDDFYPLALELMREVETPATDTFIAEQQAIGVEKLADLKNNEMFSLHPDTHAVGAIAATMSAQVKELKSFAQQLLDEVKS